MIYLKVTQYFNFAFPLNFLDLNFDCKEINIYPLNLDHLNDYFHKEAQLFDFAVPLNFLDLSLISQDLSSYYTVH